MESPPSLTERLVFNKISALVHTVIFIIWFGLGLSVDILTNVVSLEAIYLTIFVGISTQHVHSHIDKDKNE